MTSRAQTSEPSVAEVVLITGFPRNLVRQLAREILDRDDEVRLKLLASKSDSQAAKELGQEVGDRVEFLFGDVASMDLGLSGEEFQRLTDEVTTIHHLAHAPLRESNRDDAQRINVGGARSALQLASECKRLRRLCHWSSVNVAGKRKGVVLEEDLEEGQSFHSFHEQTLFEAEKLMRAAIHRLPITVFRPSTIVGDSRTGQTEDFDGPYYLMGLLVNGNHAFPVPIPGHSNAPLHLVPIDFVARAGHALSRDARAAGRTFHLCDSQPFPARRVFSLVAEQAHAKVARRSIPTGIAKTLLRAPGIEKLARAPRAFLDTVDQQIFYNTRHASELLREHGIHCPPFDSYVAALVDFIRSSHDKPAPEVKDEPDVHDPFDPD